MKVKYKCKQTDDFIPFKIIIKFETAEELSVFYKVLRDNSEDNAIVEK
jgi:hypothetical protein